MNLRLRFATHSGTAALALVSTLAMLSASCADEHGAQPEGEGLPEDEGVVVSPPDAGKEAAVGPATDADVDADLDADGANPGPENPSPELDACEDWSVQFDRFIAQHRACTLDTDCAVVGDCSHAEWSAIAAPFAKQADAMLLESPCRIFDGLGANAVCRAGACEVVPAGQRCGEPPQSECPSGAKRAIAGCGPVASTYRDGCHVSCTPGRAECPPGYSCQQTTIDPCRSLLPPGSGQATCAACGAETALCLPAPSCQLKLSVSFQGDRTLESLRSGASTALRLVLENLTDSPLALRFVDPCHGPVVEGLGDYDVWNACLSGVCDDDAPIVALTLAPREKKLWRQAIVVAEKSACNPMGLAPGKYTPSFKLGVTGVTTCGPESAELTVTP
jgi:hypothetical protein